MLENVLESLKYPFGHPSSYKIHDMLQILKELHYISSSISDADADKNRALYQQPQAQLILLHLLTNEYVTDGESKQLEKSELIQLLKLACQALTNLINDQQICDSIL